MGYVCIKPMRIQVGPGRTELRRPGDAVPEAANFPNPKLYIERGYIRADDHETLQESGYHREKLLPMRESSADDIARGAGTVAKRPESVEQLPEETDSRSELMSLSRAELNELAEEHGVENATDYPNKGELSDAVLAAQGPTE